MAKCYYCSDEVTNDDLTEVDGDWLRVCADCRDFAEKYGCDVLEKWLFGEGDVKEFKEMYRLGKTYSGVPNNQMEIKENTVYNCDCLELMKEMQRQGIVVDWIITDPPYGLKVGSPVYTKGVEMVGSAVAKRRDYSDTGDWDNQRVTKEYFDLMFKVSKNQIIFGGNYYTDYLPPTKSWVIWDKRCDDSMRDDFADCEMAYCSKGVARVFHYLYKGMLQGDMKNKDDRFHPTQKPTQLITQIINHYTKENDLIFDPFAGSCSFAVACYKTKRRYICCEKDKKYFSKGTKWLENVKSQISLFD